MGVVNPAAAGPRTRGNKARPWSSPGARAAGPQPRRQARFPGDAGQRPALPGLASGLWQAGSVAGTRTRGNTARRWSAPGPRAAGPQPAPPGGSALPRGSGPAARRASPGKRASGPRGASGLWQAGSVAGTRTRGNKARRWSAPGPRAAGPQPRRQARFPGEAGQRPALPGLASGLWQAGSVAGTRTRGNKARRWSAPGPRAAGPQPRRQARFPGEAGQRPALAVTVVAPQGIPDGRTPSCPGRRDSAGKT